MLSAKRTYRTIPAAMMSLVVAALSLLHGPFVFGDDKPDKPLIADTATGGATVEVYRVFRGSDSLLEIQWGYRNTTANTVHLLSYDDAIHFAGKVYLIDPTENVKYRVAEATPAAPNGKPAAAAATPLISPIVAIDLPAGGAVWYWAKFPTIPATTKTISLYLPNSPPLEDIPVAAAPATAPATAGALASQTGPTGLRISTTRVKRSSDGTVEVRWQYANTSDKKASVISYDDAVHLHSQVFLLDPDSKTQYFIATDDKGLPLMQDVPAFDLDAGQSQMIWAKFYVPHDAKRVSVFIPNALPMEDIPIQQNPPK